MVSSTGVEADAMITDVRLSTVVPSRMTPENAVHELTSMDLAMKLHYLKGVYFFTSDAVRGISVSDLKEPMFLLLDTYCCVAGRIRRPEDGCRRPVIKCNDSGVRIVEARANKTVDEWLDLNDCGALDDYLIYSHVLGPDLGFSPLVFIQFTWFKCGGLSVGLSWAHILGDAFSASHFISLWAQIIAGHMPTQPPNIPTKVAKEFHFPSLIPDKPFSLKRVDPVGDYWLSTNTCKMETHSFHVTAKQLDHLLSNTSSSNINVQPFQALSAIIWKSLAKIRGESSEPKIVTICSRDAKEMKNRTLDNGQLISTVQADFSVAKADTMKLLKLIAEKSLDERGMIEEYLLEGDNENSDLLMYGANLTLVNLEDADIYNVELKGSKPIFVNYSMMGVGDEGVILILPGPENGGQVITMVLPDGEGVELKNELQKGCGILF